MKRLDAMYKCRLCGKEYVECSTGGEKGNQQFVTVSYTHLTLPTKRIV